jgi:hypothetical protein
MMMKKLIRCRKVGIVKDNYAGVGSFHGCTYCSNGLDHYFYCEDDKMKW